MIDDFEPVPDEQDEFQTEEERQKAYRNATQQLVNDEEEMRRMRDKHGDIR